MVMYYPWSDDGERLGANLACYSVCPVKDGARACMRCQQSRDLVQYYDERGE